MGNAPTDGSTPAKPYKVLIVEDTQELAEVLVATLERMNLEALSETHGAKALRRYEEMRPDLLLLDLALPDMQGWKLLDSIKAKTQTDQNLKLAEVVVITAYGDPANRLMAKLQDVADYLTKPFTPTEVEKVVARVLNLKPPDGTRPPRTDLSTTK